MQQVTLSAHAKQRMQQRGIPTRLVQAILGHHDVALEAGSGCQLLRVSCRRSAATLPRMLRQDCDRLARLALILGSDGTQVVTVLRDRLGRAGRAYRRGRG